MIAIYDHSNAVSISLKNNTHNDENKYAALKDEKFLVRFRQKPSVGELLYAEDELYIHTGSVSLWLHPAK